MWDSWISAVWKSKRIKLISCLTQACRHKHTPGLLANGRVFPWHRRRLPAITATSLRWRFFKWLHAQPQERQDRLVQSKRRHPEAARKRLARGTRIDYRLHEVRVRVNGGTIQCGV